MRWSFMRCALFCVSGFPSQQQRQERSIAKTISSGLNVFVRRFFVAATSVVGHYS